MTTEESETLLGSREHESFGNNTEDVLFESKLGKNICLRSLFIVTTAVLLIMGIMGICSFFYVDYASYYAAGSVLAFILCTFAFPLLWFTFHHKVRVYPQYLEVLNNGGLLSHKYKSFDILKVEKYPHKVEVKVDRRVGKLRTSRFSFIVENPGGLYDAIQVVLST